MFKRKGSNMIMLLLIKKNYKNFFGYENWGPPVGSLDSFELLN
jgi:hypothetical protein